MEKLIFDLALRSNDASIEMDRLRVQLNKINKELRNTKEGDQFDKLRADAAKTRVEIAKLTDAQKALKREFESTKVPKDSLAGLRLEYSKLTAQVNLLTKAEREGAFGKRLISSAAKIKKDIDGIEQSLGRFTGNVGNYKTAFNGIGGLFATLGVGLGASEIINATRSYERLFAILRQGLSSDLQAETIFSQLKQFAATTPFQLEEITGAFVKLQQRGFKPTVEQLGVLGDIATSLNKNIDQLVEAILDAQQGEFERLKEFGIKFAKNKKDNTLTATFKDQQTTIANTSEAISTYILSLGKLPGVQGAATAVSKTFDGSVSNLIDNFQQLAANIGSSGGVLKGFVDTINLLVGGINKLFQQPLSAKVKDEADQFTALSTAVLIAGEKTQLRTDLIRQMQSEYPGFLTNIDAEKVSMDQLGAAIANTNLQFQKRIVLAINEEKIKEAAQKVTEAIGKQNETAIAGAKALNQFQSKTLEVQGQQSKYALVVTEGNQRQLEVQENVTKALSDQGQVIKSRQEELQGLNDVLDSAFQSLFGVSQAQAKAEIENLGKTAAATTATKNLTKAQLDEIKKQQKDLEDQIKRINELRNAVREIDAQGIGNEFDREQIQIQNERYAALAKAEEKRLEIEKRIKESKKAPTAQDKTELGLVEEETASILANLDKRYNDVEQRRVEAQQKALEDLSKYQNETLSVIASNQQALVEIELSQAENSFEVQRKELERQKNERIRLAGDNDKEKKNIEREYAKKDVELEKERAAALTPIYEALARVKIEAAKRALDAELFAIEATKQAEIEAAKKKATEQGIDPTSLIGAIKDSAAAKAAAAVTRFGKLQVDVANETANAKIEALKKVDDAEKEVSENSAKRTKDQEDQRKKLIEQAVEVAGQIANAAANIEENRLKKETDTKLSALETEYSKKKEAAQGNADLLAKLDKEYQAKKLAIEKQAARERKNIALKEAIIQGALATIKAFITGGIGASILAGITAAVQIAVISSQTFAKGGAVKFGQFGGKPHSAGGTKGVFSDGTRVEVEADEKFIILNKRASAQIRELSDFNARFGGRKFAEGGAFAFTPQIALPSQAAQSPVVIYSEARFSDEQMKQFAREVAIQTANESKTAIAEGLNDANRRTEREQALQKNRAA